ncbi:hypothetical protein D3C71_1894050 [compost metagenome]
MLDRRLPQTFRLGGEALRAILQRGQAGLKGRLVIRGEDFSRSAEFQPVVHQADGGAGVSRGVFPRLLGVVQLLASPVGRDDHGRQAEQGYGD